MKIKIIVTAILLLAIGKNFAQINKRMHTINTIDYQAHRGGRPLTKSLKAPGSHD